MATNTCPHCNHGTVYCVNSRPSRVKGIMRRRTYECASCHQRFGTEETIIKLEGGDVVLTLRHRAAIFIEEIETLAEKHFGKPTNNRAVGSRNVADDD